MITSIDNDKIKEIRKLKDKKYSLEHRKFVVEGEHLILEALKNNLLIELYALDGQDLKFDFPVTYLNEKVMKSVTDLKSIPRFIGIVKIPDNKLIGKKIVILDDIQDPGNAGTIIRNCVAFGVETIIFSKNSVSPYNEKVVRSTQGMIFNINIVIGDLDNEIISIKNKGIKIIGTSLNSTLSIKNIPYYEEYAIVFGNEGNGISDNVIKMCDESYIINMDSTCESLNVGVSCGIVLYQLYKE